MRAQGSIRTMSFGPGWFWLSDLSCEGCGEWMVGVASLKYLAESYRKGSGDSWAFVTVRQLYSRVCA